MPRRPAHAMELVELRRFGDRRPHLNTVVITDNRLVARAARDKAGFQPLVVESFLPYDLGVCFDLNVFVVMDGPPDRIRAALRRAHPRSVQWDARGDAFWTWIEWLGEIRAGRTVAGLLDWHQQRGAPPRAAPA